MLFITKKIKSNEKNNEIDEIIKIEKGTAKV